MASFFETSAGKAIGYTSGGAVTQLTDKTTGVTLDQSCGQITLAAGAIAGGAEASFTVTNDRVAATDVVVACVGSGGTSGAYHVGVGAVSSGSFELTVTNLTAGGLDEALVLNFAIIKAAAS
jgi:1-aminocyclopropane-1-carboxylate deaminase/D-cysteine desulfhydrase-like pyridoxal-dependent ACC family enzyme